MSNYTWAAWEEVLGHCVPLLFPLAGSQPASCELWRNGNGVIANAVMV